MFNPLYPGGAQHSVLPPTLGYQLSSCAGIEYSAASPTHHNHDCNQTTTATAADSGTASINTGLGAMCLMKVSYSASYRLRSICSCAVGGKRLGMGPVGMAGASGGVWEEVWPREVWAVLLLGWVEVGWGWGCDKTWV